MRALLPGQPFTYEAWMSAVRRAETFVTYGPLLEFAVDGRPWAAASSMPAGGGTLDVSLGGRQRHRPDQPGRTDRQRRDPRECAP